MKFLQQGINRTSRRIVIARPRAFWFTKRVVNAQAGLCNARKIVRHPAALVWGLLEMFKTFSDSLVVTKIATACAATSLTDVVVRYAELFHPRWIATQSSKNCYPPCFSDFWIEVEAELYHGAVTSQACFQSSCPLVVDTDLIKSKRNDVWFCILEQSFFKCSSCNLSNPCIAQVEFPQTDMRRQSINDRLQTAIRGLIFNKCEFFQRSKLWQSWCNYMLAFINAVLETQILEIVIIIEKWTQDVE